MHRGEIKYKLFRGMSPFPVDMLRIDQCYPKSQVDVNAIYESIVYQEGDTYFQVTVGNRNGFFSLRQWAIFGWEPWEGREADKT